MRRHTILSENQLRKIIRQIIRENDVGLYPALPNGVPEEELEPEELEDDLEDRGNMHVGLYPAVPPPISDKNVGLYPAVGRLSRR